MDVEFNDLKALVDFMYHGEVNVLQEQLPRLLNVAEKLKINGLAGLRVPTSLTNQNTETSISAEHNVQSSGPELILGDSDSQSPHHTPQPPPRTSGIDSSPDNIRKRLRSASKGEFYQFNIEFRAI